jgi:hypothetical protein
VIAIALAMSRPVVKASAGPRAERATTIVALVDRSGSMGASHRTGPLMNEARRLVESLLATLGHGDEMLLMPYDEGRRRSARARSPTSPRLRAATQGSRPGARHRPSTRARARGQALRESHRTEPRAVLDLRLPGRRLRGGGRPASSGPWG